MVNHPELTLEFLWYYNCMPNGEFLIEGIGGSEKEPCIRPACNSLKILSLTTSLFSSADLRLGLDY